MRPPLDVFAAAALLLPASAQAPSSLEPALATVSAGDISADIHFIASDELGGRDTPSQGLAIAARYIRARLQRLGFEPGCRAGFFHTYEVEAKRVDLERSRLRFERDGGIEELEFGEDYFFSPGGSGNFELAGPVVYAGGGTKEELAELDLAGKWALVLDSDLPWRERRANARERGAHGLIVTRPAEDEGRPYRDRYRHWVWRANSGALSLKGKEEADVPFSYVYLVRERGAELLGDAPVVGQALDVVVRETRALAEDHETHAVENVCGLWPGSDPRLAGEVIVVSAHYDHVGTREGEVYNGADDNGSGTTGLLALAEALRSYGPMRRTVLLMWVSGEEKGLLGSEAWTRDPALPDGLRAVCNINIDMIGRNAPDYLLITPTQEHEAYNGLSCLAETLAPLEGFPELGSCDDYWSRSDQKSFSSNLGIPVCFLFSDVHEDYHQPSDTPDKIDCDKVRRVVRLVLRMLHGLQADQLLAEDG